GRRRGVADLARRASDAAAGANPAATGCGDRAAIRVGNAGGASIYARSAAHVTGQADLPLRAQSAIAVAEAVRVAGAERALVAIGVRRALQPDTGARLDVGRREGNRVRQSSRRGHDRVVVGAGVGVGDGAVGVGVIVPAARATEVRGQ